MIDSIAYHVDQSVNYVQEATEGTKMAKVYRRKSNKVSSVYAEKLEC